MSTIEPGPAECLNCGFLLDFRLGGTRATQIGIPLCPNCGGWPLEIRIVDIEPQMQLFKAKERDAR